MRTASASEIPAGPPAKLATESSSEKKKGSGEQAKESPAHTIPSIPYGTTTAQHTEQYRSIQTNRTAPKLQCPDDRGRHTYRGDCAQRDLVRCLCKNPGRVHQARRTPTNSFTTLVPENSVHSSRVRDAEPSLSASSPSAAGLRSCP